MVPRNSGTSSVDPGFKPNLSQPITCYFSDRRGRLCHLEHVCAGRLGTLSYNSFRWKAVRLFNCLPQHVRNVSSCSTIIFKKKLDQFLCNWTTMEISSTPIAFCVILGIVIMCNTIILYNMYLYC